MSTIITKYSDYAIQSIEYFIEQIEGELLDRDLPGLFNDKIQMINVTKQHPLVTLMAAKLSEDVRGAVDRSGIIPAISVTPANPVEEGFTLGQGFQTEIVDSTWETQLKEYLAKTDTEIQTELLITKKQINLILAAYKKNPAGTVRVEKHQWRKNEEINVSAWSDIADLDIILGNLLDSIFADIAVGLSGDDSKIQYFKYKITKGLTNFNYGRTLFGTEISLTFMNTYNNYTIYSDEVLSGHDLIGTFNSPGQEE